MNVVTDLEGAGVLAPSLLCDLSGVDLVCSLSGMLRRWDDSQRFLADMPQLICEETANYLILWCMELQQEGVCSEGGRLLFLSHQRGSFYSRHPLMWRLRGLQLVSTVSYS